MAQRTEEKFDPKRFLTGHGSGQARLQLAAGHVVATQGDPVDALFYIESGWVKLSIVVPNGKEAVMLRGEGEFFGTRSLIPHFRRMATGTALTDCSLVRISQAAAIRMLREQPDFAEMFVRYLLRQGIDSEKSIIDQLTSSAEKRLARTLVRLAHDGAGDRPQSIPTRINQTDLAGMIGTTRSRVNSFMTKFRRQGFIEYDREGHLTVHRSLRDTLR